MLVLWLSFHLLHGSVIVLNIETPELQRFNDLPREAAAAALAEGQAEMALMWLEQGRSIIWNQILELNHPTDMLRELHPEICSRFETLAQALRTAGSREAGIIQGEQSPLGLSLEDEARKHRRDARDWAKLLQEIRTLPGFQEFLLPKKVHQLKEASQFGPVIVVNVHQTRV